jgi:transposase
VDKVRDVVGLYLDPPERALVLCVDEKSQIQALDRSQPIAPMLPGVPERATHDYKRSGTSSLFAALDIASGKVIGSLHSRHRTIEFKKFLGQIDAAVPAELDVHLILDNYTTHKTKAVRRWLLAHPRFHLHFTPTGASWLNLVERWFAELTNKKLRRGAHRSVRELKKTSATGSRTGTRTPARTSGQRPQTRFSTASPDTANESTTQDTRTPPSGRGSPQPTRPQEKALPHHKRRMRHPTRHRRRQPHIHTAGWSCRHLDRLAGALRKPR